MSTKEEYCPKLLTYIPPCQTGRIRATNEALHSYRNVFEQTGQTRFVIYSALIEHRYLLVPVDTSFLFSKPRNLLGFRRQVRGGSLLG
jgi:hypothetical protein